MILTIAASILLAALVYSHFRLTGAVSHMTERHTPPTPPDVLTAQEYDDRWVRERLPALEAQVVDLFQAVADGIDHVERNEKRVRGIVQGAQKRFEKAGLLDAGVQAEADTLSSRDAEGSGPEGVLPLHADMGGEPETPRDAWSTVPGMRSN